MAGIMGAEEWPVRKNPLYRLYSWVLSLGRSPYSMGALFVLAFVESSFFPVPPDVLLITLCLSTPRKSYMYALICSIGSVSGGALGYLIGLKFMEWIGKSIIVFYGLSERFNEVAELYEKYNAIAVAIAGFTPIPYKLFTIAAGFFAINFYTFLLASLVSRSARFFFVSSLIYFFGEKVKIYIEKYFNLFTIIFVLLLIGGFLIIRAYF